MTNAQALAARRAAVAATAGTLRDRYAAGLASHEDRVSSLIAEFMERDGVDFYAAREKAFASEAA